MRLLTLAYPAASEFLSAYDASAGTLTARTKTEAKAGDELLVEVAFPRLLNRPILRTKVTAVRNGELVLAIDAGDTPTRDFLVKNARGEVKPEDGTHREHKRIPTWLPVEYAHEGAPQKSVVEDLSAGGCFVRCPRPPNVAAPVTLTLFAPGDARPLLLSGVVAWVRDGDDAGFGVEFDAPESPDGKRLRQLLRKAIGSGEVELGEDS